uniref:Uncharacterized protein LOC104231013 n=1 Tax=Nicotiana sylvestris TaxID=4096 RepID=A0A1U7WQM5_NICSY|nr:PREDICTED: uncharacterized protein LOC104231013 [Nicotiana sylvestris]
MYQKNNNEVRHYSMINIWHSKVPFKISFLAWRMLRKKLLLDDALFKFGNPMVSKCHCCIAPKYETQQHVFIDSEVAIKLWRSFGGPLGIRHHNRPIREVLQIWFGTKPVNRIHKMIFNITPWPYVGKSGKALVHVNMGTRRRWCTVVCTKILFWILRTTLKLAFPSCKLDQSWPKICEIVEKLRPIPNSLIVLWELPHVRKVKVDCDGNFFHSSGLAGMGGIVKDCRGDLIMAFVVPNTCSNNDLAEGYAAKHGIEWCIQHGFSDIILEIDSLITANIYVEAKHGGELQTQSCNSRNYTDFISS